MQKYFIHFPHLCIELEVHPEVAKKKKSPKCQAKHFKCTPKKSMNLEVMFMTVTWT